MFVLTIFTEYVTEIEFLSEKEARDWMDSWETKNLNNLKWKHEETKMELTEGDNYDKLICVSYCSMDPFNNDY
jgi:hypothetical protein